MTTASPALNALQSGNVLSDVKFEGGTLSAEPTKSFYAVLTADCPVDSITFGNVTFHKQTEKRLADGRVVSVSGQLLHLTDKQIEHCKRVMSTHCLRIYYTRDESGRLKRKGQEDRQNKRWAYPGIGPDSKPFLRSDGKGPLEEPELVPLPPAMYSPSKDDVPWTTFCRLMPLSAENVAFAQMFIGGTTVSDFQTSASAPGSSEHIDASRANGMPEKPLDVVDGILRPGPPVDLVAQARDFNQAELAKEQSLGAEAGIASRRRGRGTTAERMD